MYGLHTDKTESVKTRPYRRRSVGGIFHKKQGRPPPLAGGSRPPSLGPRTGRGPVSRLCLPPENEVFRHRTGRREPLQRDGVPGLRGEAAHGAIRLPDPRPVGGATITGILLAPPPLPGRILRRRSAMRGTVPDCSNPVQYRILMTGISASYAEMAWHPGGWIRGALAACFRGRSGLRRRRRPSIGIIRHSRERVNRAWTEASRRRGRARGPARGPESPSSGRGTPRCR